MSAQLRLSLSRLITVIAIGAALCPLALSAARAQSAVVAAEPGAPRFLMSIRPGDPPVPIDVRSVPALGRRIKLEFDNVPLGDALERIEKISGLRMVYSSDAVPVRLHVRLNADDLTVAAALTEVLFNTGVDVLLSEGRIVLIRAQSPQAGGTITGRVIDANTKSPIRGATIIVEGTALSAITGDSGQYTIPNVPAGAYTVTARRIGYAKVSRAVTVTGAELVELAFSIGPSASLLDQVVVTGTLVPTAQREVPSPVTVVTAQTIQKFNVTYLPSLFQGLVPGILNYGVGASDDVNIPKYYVRGATSVSNNGSSSPLKVYIDGIEMADGSVLSTLNPATIDRIEILRGPQASTLYGAGAINGVMQIFTKRGVATPKPYVTGSLAYTGMESQYVNGVAARYVADASVYGGNQDFNYNVTSGIQYTTQYGPGNAVKKANAAGGFRYKNGPLTADATLRIATETAFPSLSPIVKQVLAGQYRALNSLTTLVPGDLTTQIPQQTMGLTLGYTSGSHWQHTMVIGRDQGGRASVDGFSAITRFRKAPYTTIADSLKAYGEGNAQRTSVSYITTGSYALGRQARTDLTFGGDYWHFAGANFAANATPEIVGTLGITSGASIRHVDDHNSGLFTQARLALDEVVFLTAGIRAERNPNFGANHPVDYSPRFGVAIAHDLGSGVTAKLRASEGRAVRPPTPGQKTALFPCASACTVRLANEGLVTEAQRGADGGLDLFYRSSSLSVSYYNQTASNLISSVNVASLHPELLTTYTGVIQFQNAGSVKNSGWETQLSTPIGRPLLLTGAYTVMRSTMQKLALAYTGRYHVGDRVLGIPERTGFLSLALTPWPTSRLTLQADMTYLGHRTVDVPAYDKYYDRFNPDPRGFTTPDDILTYPALTKFALSSVYKLRSRADVFIRVDNVANNNATEFDPVNVLTGRTSTIGLRFR